LATVEFGGKKKSKWWQTENYIRLYIGEREANFIICEIIEEWISFLFLLLSFTAVGNETGFVLNSCGYSLSISEKPLDNQLIL